MNQGINETGVIGKLMKICVFLMFLNGNEANNNVFCLFFFRRLKKQIFVLYDFLVEIKENWRKQTPLIAFYGCFNEK